MTLESLQLSQNQMRQELMAMKKWNGTRSSIPSVAQANQSAAGTSTPAITPTTFPTPITPAITTLWLQVLIQSLLQEMRNLRC